MRFHSLESAPAFIGFGVHPTGGTPVLPPGFEVRKMDRYGTIGLATAHAALQSAGVLPPTAIDERWGVSIGSSLGCASANGRFYLDLLGRTPGGSPAHFVRTVSNAVTGDVSMALRLGGPSETFVSGWTAGGDAVVSAGMTLDRDRADRMLVGAVEAPEDLPPGMLASIAVGDGASREALPPREAAAFALLEARSPRDGLRLRAFWRGHDAAGIWSMGAALDATGDLPIEEVVVANPVPETLLERWRDESARLPLVYRAGLEGERGAAGVMVALSEVAARGVGGALVIGRGVEGSVVALAVAR